jgi:hypothetical protein
VTITSSTFSENLATAGNANGGAIAHYGGSQMTLANCSFAGNETLALPPGAALALNAAGGAIESDSGLAGFFGNLGQPTMTINHCSFTDNLAHVAAAGNGEAGGSAQGGALDLEDGAAGTVSDCTFVNNRVQGADGGAADSGIAAGGGGAVSGLRGRHQQL